jgi:conjugative transposon TraM protein
MKERMGTTKKQIQRKMLWVLPILAVPFLTILFWSMGGGKSSISDKPTQDKGFNSSIPETSVPENGFNKLNYYERADADSSRRENLKSKDPFFMTGATLDVERSDLEMKGEDKLLNSSFRNPQEQKVMERLKALQQAVSHPEPVRESKFKIRDTETSYEKEGEMKRLETLAASMNTAPQEDPEMQQINGMLENILDIQHPQRVQERIKKEQRLKEGNTFIVSKPEEDNVIGNLSEDPMQTSQGSNANAFYSLENISTSGEEKNAIAASIAESQTCVNGSVVKLRLSQEIVLNGSRIPKNTFIYGMASLKGERLTVEINSIRFQNSVFPVELLLYDMDGIEGIHIPGTINRDVAKASAERSIQPLGITSLDDSWGSQAAGAGIEAAKSLLSKKVKLVKVMVKSGYQVLLKDKKRNNN